MSNDRTEYITQVAQQLGITIPPDEMGRVKGVFGNLERAAAQLGTVELPADTMSAAVFRPEVEQGL